MNTTRGLLGSGAAAALAWRSLAVQAKAGTLKLLAIALPTRLKEYPDVPTFAEAGCPAVNLSGWSLGILPVGTPKPLADKLAAEITRIVRLPEISARISSLGFLAEGGTPDTARQFFDNEWVRWGAAIQASKVTLE